ncbi:MAG: LytR/AlgR family response regulator transcription factor [Gemmatimonadaceae bacterium]
MRDRLRTLVVDDEPLARAHLRMLLEERDDVVVAGECGDGRTAVERIRSDRPGLVLLDIQMPELDGLQVVREVGVSRMPAVIFVTAYDQHALAAFDLHAVDYLVKPVKRDRFGFAIDRVVSLARAADTAKSWGATPAIERLLRAMQAERPGSGEPSDDSRPLDRIAIRADGRVAFLPVADIEWIEAADDHVRIHTGKHTYMHRDTLTHLEQRLPSGVFLRVHRSSMVNVERIREMQPWFHGDWVIILGSGARVQSGKSYRARIREFLERAT